MTSSLAQKRKNSAMFGFIFLFFIDLVWTEIVLELYLISLILHNLVMSFFRNYTKYHFSRSILLFLLAFEDVVHIALIDAGLIVCLELKNVSDIADLNIILSSFLLIL